ncbi:MAG: phosphonate ABC transporter, permease protein PhnE [Betaproteobacteria bacterium]|nr:phosphonate ABC transporter, permease protein PhnE [Betaproteobacteria bacterium]
MNLRAASISAADIASLRAQHPRAFSRSPRERATIALLIVGVLAFAVFCLVRFDVTPTRLFNGLDRVGKIATALIPPSPGDAFWDLCKAMLESIAMAFLGTLLAAIIALPLGFLGARNVLPIRLLRFPIRRSFDFLRGVDALVWALVYVRAVGLGPLAGVLAIATTDIGIFAKLFAEAIENVEKKQVEGIRASGGNAVKTLRFGVLPQVLPIMLSNVLYMFESNTRSATILGIIGAGGIGFALSDRIRAHRWDEVGFIIIMIIVVVALIDFLSHQLRTRVIKAGINRPLFDPAAAAASKPAPVAR